MLKIANQLNQAWK